MQPVEVDTVAAQLDLRIAVLTGGDGWNLVATYATDLFDAATVALLLERLCGCWVS